MSSADQYGYLVLTDADRNLVRHWRIGDDFGDVRYRPDPDGKDEENRVRGARKVRAQNDIMGEIQKLIAAAHDKDLAHEAVSQTGRPSSGSKCRYKPKDLDRYGYLVLTDADDNLVQHWRIADNFGDVRYYPDLDGRDQENRTRGSRKIRVQNEIMGEIQKLITIADGKDRARTAASRPRRLFYHSKLQYKPKG